MDTRRSIPATPPDRTRTDKNWGTAIGWDSTLGGSLVNTFRYGYTRIDTDTLGPAQPRHRRLPLHRRLAFDDHQRRQQRPRHRDAQLRQRPLDGEGPPHVQVRRQHALHPQRQLHLRQLVHHAARRTARGWRASAGATGRAARARRRPTAAACRRWPPAGRSAYADSLIPLLGIVSQTNVLYNYTHRRAGARRSARRCERALRRQRVRALRAGQLAAARQPDGERRPPLRPLLAAVGSQRPAGRADREPRRMVRPARREHARRHSVERERDDHVRAGRPGQRRARLLRVGQEQLRAARSRRRGRRSRRGSCAAATASSTTASAPASPRRSTTAARSACRTTSTRRSAASARLSPEVRFTDVDTVPVTYPDAPPAGFPATPDDRRRRDHARASTSRSRTPYSHVFNVDHRQGAGQELRHRSRLRRPPRPQPAGPPRPRDAAEPHRPGVRASTTSPRRGS